MHDGAELREEHILSRLICVWFRLSRDNKRDSERDK